MYNNQFDMPYGYNYYYNSQQSMISIQDSIQIALNYIYGQVIKAELDRENGLLVYEVVIIDPQGRRYEIDVDAFTGNIVNAELDT